MTTETTKADEIAVVIEEAIVSGELAPGVVLRQEQLSEQFGVSRTPIREGVRKLAALGLVDFEPNRGVRVRGLSREGIYEAFLVRAELESLATKIAAGKISSDELVELAVAERRFARLTEELRSHEPGADRRRLTTQWVFANHAFHDIVYRVADAPMVERMAKSARRTFSGPGLWAPGDSSIDDLYAANVEQHRAIRQALAARSANGAKAIAREHVLHSFTLLDTILSHVGAQPRDWHHSRSRGR